MRAVVQRVKRASVTVDGAVTGSCEKGLLVLVAAHKADREADARKMADKILGLRIFEDAEGKMNLSLRQLHEAGEAVGILAVSNFTVYGDTDKSRRPSFVDSAPYATGEVLFNEMLAALRVEPIPVGTGVFGAEMAVELLNDGPVTVILDAGPTGQP